MWSRQRMVFLQWSRQIDDYNQKCVQTLSIIKARFVSSPREAELQSPLPGNSANYVITPRNSPRLYLRDAREHYKLNKNVGKWWMNERNDAYSSQITTSTMLNPRHG